MNQKWLSLTLVAGAITGLGLLIQPTSAQASAYTVTRTEALNPTPRYLTSSKQVTYAWNLSHTKKLQIINPDAADVTWYADQQVTLKHNGKSAVYYRVNRGLNGSRAGYVWRGYFKTGYAKNDDATLTDGNYYRVNAATTVTYAKKSFVLPKGTVVRASTYISKRQEYLSVSLNNLSYTLKQQQGIGTTDIVANAGLASKVNWTKISAPNYVLPNTGTDTTPVWMTDLYPGSSDSTASTQRLKITTDGYVEFYNNGSHQSSSTVYGVGAPTSRKIIDSSVSGDTITLTYDQAIPGLSDTAVTVNGKTEYQLTIQKKAQLTDKTDYALANYVVGGQPFYSWASAGLLKRSTKNTVKTLSASKFDKLDKEFFNSDTFYKTTKAVKIAVPFTGYNGYSSINKTVTLPKGTVVAGGDVSRTKVNGKYVKVVSLRTSVLSANLLKSGYAAGLVASSGWQTVATSATNLQKVKRPNYLPTYSYGNLYLGSTGALQNLGTKLSTQSVIVTSNGYVEVHQNKASDNAASYYSKPKASAKIQRTVVKHHTRQLFLSKKLSGFKTTKVSYQGKTQYRLDLTNQHKYRYIEPGADDDGGPAYFNLYTVGGKTFYTWLGNING